MTVQTDAATARVIFTAALKLPGEQARREYLASVCGEDEVLRKQVEALLAASDQDEQNPLHQAAEWAAAAAPEPDGAPTETFISKFPDEDVSESAPPLDVSRHPQIGPYKIREQIGEGGMGDVYVAEQTEPVRRKVALKVIKPGMDTKEVVTRFEAERQALAMMSHTNIAKVLDGGATDAGRPYFVMELVRGVPITQFCDEHELSTRERLELFLPVCQAVQHAHMKGIIHRDLKPSNVIVELDDVRPVPKVIDFGVAKATGQQLSNQTIYTQFAQLVGTPLYMSPEQAKQSSTDIDTRSDIYSLGVLLYELLTGTTPFDKCILSSVDPTELRRILCEDDPPRPSARVSTLTNKQLSTISTNRQTEPHQLSLSLQRELDWIVMKSLEKDRTRRYDSASALAADIQRYLDDEPVEAHPPSMGYRLRKLARRNKGWLTAALLIAFVLVVATVISINLAVRATDAEHQAQHATEALRGLLYASDVVLAAQDLRNNDAQQARSRLARHIPDAGQPDLRGFEWQYLWKQQDLSGDVIADAGSAVYDLQISPTGDGFAAVGEDATIRLFDLASHELQFAIPTGQGETNGVAFSPDGQRLATAGDDGTVRIWDLATQRRLVNIQAHEGLAFQVVFSLDGKSVASCGEDTVVRLWSASDGGSLGTLNVHAKDLETVAISPSGAVAAGGKVSEVSLWNLRSRQPIWEQLEANPIQDAVSGVAFSDNNFLAYGTVGGRLTIAEPDRQTVVFRRRLANGIQSIDFAPSGNWLVVGDRAGHLQTIPFEDGLWNMEATRQWDGHDGRIYCVTVTPDSRRVVSGGADGRIVSWELFAQRQRRQVRIDKVCNNLTHIDDHRIAVGAMNGIYICNADGRIEMDFGDVTGDWRVEYAGQASLLFAKSVLEVVAWKLPQQTEVLRWVCDGGHDLGSFAVAPDGRTVILRVDAPSRDREIQILDVSTQTVISRWPARSAKWIEVSGDGRWLAHDSNNDIRLIDLERREILDTWPAHDAAIRGLEFSADGASLASVSDDRTIRIWSVPGGELISSTLAHRTSAARLAMTSNGQRIATGGDDRMLRFWDGATLQLVWEHPLQEGQIKDLAFIDADQQLFCLCGDHDIVILDGSPGAGIPQSQ